jgi:PKD repeat protein
MVATDDSSSLDAALTVTVSEGVYYLAVEATSTGDPVTGYSEYGSLGQYTVSAVVHDPGTLAPPVASVGASTLSAPAPAVIEFDSFGSYDPDGTIIAYEWDFGDGTGASGASVAKTYETPGTYTVELTVFDNDGLSASDTLSVAVEEPVAELPTLSVAGIDMATVAVRKKISATATVLVVDANGVPVGSAFVSGEWSGVVTGTASGTTSVDGQVILESPPSTKSGIFTFTVASVAADGYTYDALGNVETADSIGEQPAADDGTSSDDGTTKPPRGKKK